MSAVKKRKILKIVSIVTFILAVVSLIVYISLGKSDKMVKTIGGYVKSYEKVSDTEYTAKVIINRMDKVIEKEVTYETEPQIGKSETFYYMANAKNDILESKPSVFEKFMWLGIISGVLFVASVVSYVMMKQISVRKNAKVAKKIKVDEKSILR